MENYIIISGNTVLNKNLYDLSLAEKLAEDIARENFKKGIDQKIYVCKLDPYLAISVSLCREIIPPNADLLLDIKNTSPFSPGQKLRFKSEKSNYILSNGTLANRWETSWGGPTDTVVFKGYTNTRFENFQNVIVTVTLSTGVSKDIIVCEHCMEPL